MLKNICFLLMSALLFGSCSDKDNNVVVPDDGPDSETEKQIQVLPLILTTDKSGGHIYEQVGFSLQDSTYTGPNGGFAILLNYADDLDSLIWRVEGNEERVHLLEKNGTSDSKFTIEWGHYFYLPGNYKTLLHGYKDGEIVVRDSAVTEIFADGDFLNVNWEQLDQNLNKMVGYTNEHMKDYSLQVFTSLRDDVLSSRLSVRFDSFDYSRPDAVVGDREIELLGSYITELYGEAKYHLTDTPAPDELLKLFKTTFKEEQVLKIWRAGKSNIALIKSEDTDVIGFGYQIHAEPI
ncbi:hypothetical protein FXV77_02835 [Sphingobacterium phlebotomi]|uniref:Lipoprotein n=1 Tax=Sphingobacterium phlebotomi TaxID=2605433 RepID=A0A5D4HDL9_9SPHI|nr:hypothetical protein [Sphingobacterium phlebotomi]TYR38233.1 hypothetical protein FXV77_02835 [Sphingobacterium phlebotomi]